MFYLWLILIEVVVLGAVVYYLKVILTRNITNATSHLHELNQDYNQKLEDAKKKQASADRYYDEMLLKSKTDAEKSKVQILKEAHENQEAIVKEARKQSEEIIKQAQKAGEQVLNELEDRINSRALDKACEVVYEILPKEIGREMHSLWVEDLIGRGLGQIERMNIEETISEADIVTAYALTDSEKERLLSLLAEKLKRAWTLKETVAPELIAGLRVTLGNVVIDGSLQYRIKEYARNYTKRA